MVSVRAAQGLLSSLLYIGCHQSGILSCAVWLSRLLQILSHRMSKFANAIMNANQVGKRSKKRKGKDKGENSQKEGLFLLCVPKNVPDMDDLNVNGCRETVVPIDDARSSAGSDGQAAAGEVKNKPDLSQCTRKS